MTNRGQPKFLYGQGDTITSALWRGRLNPQDVGLVWAVLATPSFISCSAFLERGHLKDEVSNSLPGLEKPWEKVIYRSRLVLYNLCVSHSFLTCLLSKETFLCSPPIFLMVKVMELGVPGPAACCDDNETVSFSIM